MQARTSDPHGRTAPPEVALNAIAPRRGVAQGVRRSGFSLRYRNRVTSESTTGERPEPSTRDRGPRVWQIVLRFGKEHRWRWVIALAMVAVSTMVAAIAVLANLVVLVYTVEMTNPLAWQAVVALAIAGTLMQISLLSFMVAWEKSQPLP